MKHGNNKQNMTAEQKTKQEAEKKTLEPELETEDLLKELKAVLEISEEEKTEKPEHTDSGSSQKEAKPEAVPAETPAEEKKPEKTAEAPNKSEPLSAVSYASMAHAVQEAKKEPTGRFSRDAVDDETLLAELQACPEPHILALCRVQEVFRHAGASACCQDHPGCAEECSRGLRGSDGGGHHGCSRLGQGDLYPADLPAAGRHDLLCCGIRRARQGFLIRLNFNGRMNEI